MTEQQQLSPQAEEAEALALIARTPEGRLLHRYLRRVLETVFDTAETGALLAHNGRRSLARDLMRLMADGIDDGRPDHTNDPILARAGNAVAVARARRRDPSTFPRVDSLGDDAEPGGAAEV